MIERANANFLKCSTCPNLAGAKCLAAQGIANDIFGIVAIRGCPLNLFPPIAKPGPPPAPVDTAELWREWHRRPFLPDLDLTKEPAWFEAWLARVPEFGCACQSKFREIIRARPPEWVMWAKSDAGREMYFAYTVSRHNEVSVSLDPPRLVMGVDAARELYQR